MESREERLPGSDPRLSADEREASGPLRAAEYLRNESEKKRAPGAGAGAGEVKEPSAAREVRGERRAQSREVTERE